MLDGSKALRAAVTAVFGRAALVQRCQIHKTREHPRPSAGASAALGTGDPQATAYQSEDVKTATRLLRHLARRLDQEHPCAAASVREGLEETVTVLTLGLSPRLQRSLATTNAVESLISRTRHVKRNVKRWRGGQMMLRWVAAGVLEAAKGFRRLKGHADMPQLVAASAPVISASASETLRRWSRSRRMSPEPPPNSNSGRDIPSRRGRIRELDPRQGRPPARPTFAQIPFRQLLKNASPWLLAKWSPETPRTC